MFLRKNYSKVTGRTFLSIVQGYRGKDGLSKQKTVQKVGYLDVLQNDYDDPVAHFEEVVKNLNKEQQNEKNISIVLDLNKQIERNIVSRKNYGHVVFSKIYHELEIDTFLKNSRRHKNFEFNTDAIMRLLVFSRLLYPCSKRGTVNIKDKFFDNFDFSLDDVYNALTHFNQIAAPLQQHLHEKVVQQHNRNTNIVYYDVTNYYFEIDKEDELRRKGASKEKRKDPIVQMGLLMDTEGLPISYKLFPGNKHDSQTLMPILTEIKKKFNVKRVITVADKGLNSGDNIAYATILNDGYIYSKSIRGASEEFKAWAVSENGFRCLKNSNEYKLKSKIEPKAVIHVTVEDNGKRKKKKDIEVEQKWIVFYSKNYEARAKHKREDAIAKALKMIANPAKYKSTFDYGAAGYIKNLKIDKDTGEIINIEETLFLDRQKIDEEAQYDGYYAIITSEINDTDEHIIETYKGLWRIEESFKVTKSVLCARPIFLHNEDHINAHFLICFIALLISRIVEKKLDRKYTIATITETLRNVSCSHLDKNLWLFDFANDVTDHMNNIFGTDFGKHVMTLQEIKSSLAKAKK